MAGRKAKPTALKLLDGNPGKRAANRAEPKPSPGAPRPPTWLSRDAKAEWRRVVPALDRIGMLDQVDRASLAAYCSAWSDYVEADRAIREHGVLMTVEKARYSRSGDLLGVDEVTVKNPAVQIKREVERNLRGMCTDFGMNPSARGRMALPAVDEEDLTGILSPVRERGA